MTSMYLPEQAVRMYFACYLLSVLAMEEAEDFLARFKKSTLIAHLINKQPTIKAAFIRNLFLIPAAFCFFVINCYLCL